MRLIAFYQKINVVFRKYDILLVIKFLEKINQSRNYKEKKRDVNNEKTIIIILTRKAY
jgi:hypothetical protein